MLNYQVLSALGIDSWQAHSERHEGATVGERWPGFITERAIANPACLVMIETEKYQVLAPPLQKMLTAMLNVLQLPCMQLGITYYKRGDEQATMVDNLQAYLYHYQPQTLLVLYKTKIFPVQDANGIFVTQIKHPAVLSAYPKEKRAAYQNLLKLKKQLQLLHIT